MSGVELGLAIVGTLDLCLKYGTLVVSKYKAFQEAESEIQERVTTIEATWIKISQQLEYLQRVWEALDEDYRDLQGRILQILQRKLQAAVLETSKLERHSPPNTDRLGKRKAGRYVLSVKKSLDNAIQDLQSWQKEFDTTWFLVLRIANATIDTELAKRPGTEKLSVARHLRDALQPKPQRKSSVSLPEAELKSASRSDIPFSTSQLVEIPRFGTFILDSVDFSSRKDASMFKRNVRDLAVKLQQVEPYVFHILRCFGIVRTTDPTTHQILSYDFIFCLPENCSQPQSLRSHLLAGASHSLGARIRIAKQLATSISYIHVLEFVHKNIRPETVLIFQDGDSQLGPLFLLGFKTFRSADGKTLRLGNSEWAENIYQHPDRQGTNPDADYIIQHDIYSLGVCLLEIGLWGSFVTPTGDANLFLRTSTPNLTVLGRNESFKNHFTQLAMDRLPARMGEKYTQVVVNCLTCMDETNPDFGDESEFEDEDGVLIGVKYIEKVWRMETRRVGYYFLELADADSTRYFSN
ncbi:hypothetical protein NUU61_007704 [Penicillium alfredii]|uniref:Protein kinase domain-containing protein n=1 Tax=Penicillium alfredii TaxID=1506179 RepID=A0A9W9ER05_9EURO|nr:uncharacterized protein NUU61_007704 [Penicillium alfredii]KAJ5086397.1 hypothetical protein NUU61_007704 [Penicillium alfredii]